MMRWVPFLVALFACEAKEDSQPVANAGIDQLVTPGVTVTLDGSESSDRDGRIRSYAWTRVSAPEGSTSPFEGTGANPAFLVDSVGRYVFSLSVTDDAGNLSHPDMVEVVAVEPAERPIAMLETRGDLGTGLPLLLDGSKSTANGPISLWNFTIVQSPSDSTARIESGDNAASAVLTPDATGTWIVGLEVSDGTLASRVVTNVFDIGSTPNQPPVAVCGREQEVPVGTMARVTGAASLDPEGEPLTFVWSLEPPQESDAVIFDDGLTEARFIPDIEGAYTLSLVVSDGMLRSSPCTVRVQATASPDTNQPPIADAGPDQSVPSESTEVVLDGSASFDPEGDFLTYQWSLASTPPASVLTDDDIEGATDAQGIFVPDRDGAYITVLTVCDGLERCATDSALVVVGDDINQAPVANAGVNRDIEVGVELVLDGSSSVDPDDDALTYRWSLLSQPVGSAALIRAAADVNAGLVADIEGTYTVRLEVNDGRLSATDTMVVTAFAIGTPLAPVCAAIEDAVTDMGVGIAVSGLGTTDPNGDDLRFSWAVIDSPDGAEPSFGDPTAIETVFIPDLPGVYEVEFTASDSAESCTTRFRVDSIDTTPNQAPVCDSGGDISITLGDTALLNGANTRDPDGDPLTYVWQVYESPGAAPVAIVDATRVEATFTPDVVGVYTLSFTANDGEDECLEYLIVDVQRPVSNTPPSCELFATPEARVGETIVFDATGSVDADGDELSITWALDARPPGSTAVPVTDGFIATIDTDVAGTYQLSILISDGEESCVSATEVVVGSENQAPTCSATGPSTVESGESFELSAADSTDPDGDVLTFLWTVVEQPEGSTAILTDPAATTPSFVPDRPGEYAFAVTVSDGTLTCIAGVDVEAAVSNTPPACNAGDNQTIDVGEFASFDGSGTVDADGDPLAFYWYVIDRPEGSTSGLVGRDTDSPRFAPDIAGEYTIEVTADDGIDDCSDTLTLTAQSNTPPSCDAGVDAPALVGEFIELDGSASRDDDGDSLSYYWSVTTRPEASTNGLIARDAEVARFQVDAEGSYVFEVEVDDGTESCTDTVTITASTNTAPVCSAGLDVTTTVDAFVGLDASASRDDDGDALTYYWSVTDRPETSTNGLIERDSEVARFQVDAEGTFVFEIEVDDGTDSCTDTVTVTAVTNTAPVCSAGLDLEGEVGERSLLDGTATTDEDGDSLSYYWYVTGRPDGSVNGLIAREAVVAGFIPDVEGTYTFEITATDGSESCSDTVTLNVAGSATPSCDAGPDLEGQRYVRSILDGSGTTDPDGDPLTYYWYVSSRPDGSVHGLIDRESASASFIPDRSGAYTFELTATDGTETCTDTMTLSVTAGTPPVCDAGPDQTGETDVRVNFDGRGTADPDGDDLSYFWYVASRPEGSVHGLINRDGATPSFIPDVAGEYTFEITASDGEDTCSDIVTVTVTGDSPEAGDDTGSVPGGGEVRADAGRDQSLCDIDTIDLNGSESTGSGLRYAWSFTSTPPGSTLTDADIDDADSPLASFTPDAEGRFEVQLAVEASSESDVDSVAITVDTDGSVLTLHLDEGSGSRTADDSPFANDASFLNADWTGGRFFSGLSFDGSAEITIPDATQLDIASNFTIDWWMRTADIGEDWRAILTKGTEDDYNYSLWTYQDELHFYGVDSSGAYVSTSAASSTIGDGAWHHYAVTVTDSAMTLYEDGSVLASASISNPLQTNDSDLYIGRPAYSTVADTFVGSLDEIVIRSEALGADTIAFIAGSDTQYCTTDEDTRRPTGEIINPASATSTDIGYVKVEGTADDESAIATVTVNGSSAAPTSDNFGTWVAYVPLTEGRNTLRMQVADVAGNINESADTVNVDRVDLCGDETILLLAFDEDESGTATDWGPSENSGSEVATNRVIGRYGNALSVSGEGGVVVPHDDALTTIDEITVEMWMRRDGPTDAVEVLAAKGIPASFGMLLFTDSLIFGFDDDAGTRWAATTSGVTDGDWHHVVGVFNGTELSLYVDGSLEGSTPTLGALPVSSTADITIGSYYGTGGFYDGEIDQIHVFDTALSTSEVVDQYAAGESCPLGDNLALTASASASSTLNPLFRVDNVIDNNTQEEGTADYTMWLGEEGASGWVTLDFGAVVGILRTRWANTHNRLSYDRATADYRIEASTTGAFGDEAIRIASGTGSLDEELVFNTDESTPVAARYLRFYADSFVGLGPGLNEIQVYGLE